MGEMRTADAESVGRIRGIDGSAVKPLQNPLEERQRKALGDLFFFCDLESPQNRALRYAAAPSKPRRKCAPPPLTTDVSF